MREQPLRNPLILALLLLLAACTTVPADGAGPIHAFVNGHVWDGRAFRSRTLYVQEGRFVGRPEDGPIMQVDLAGGFVLPALGEAHHHRICDPRGTARFLAAGIAYVGVMNARASTRACQAEQHGPDQVEIVNALAGITARGAHPAEIGLFFLQADEIDGEWVHYVDTEADIDRIWPRILASPPDMLKLYLGYSEDHARLRDDPSIPAWYRGLDPALVPELVRRAHARGIRVAAHVLSARDFAVAVDSGVDIVAHMPGFAPGPAFTPEQPNPWLTALLDQPERYLIPLDLARRAARREILVMTTLSAIDEVESSPTVDRIRAFQLRVAGENIRRLRAAGVQLLIGSDRYDGTSVDEALFLIRSGLFTPRDAIRNLTRDVPRALFPGREIGTLDPGAEASFAVYRANPLADPQQLQAPLQLYKRGRQSPLPLAGVPSPASGIAAANGRIVRGTTLPPQWLG